MYKKPEKKEKPAYGNIKDYAKNKLLYTLVKPNAINSIALLEDLDDPWFILVLTYKTKSGIIVDNTTIIASDIKTWLSHLTNMGYETV